MSHEEAVFEVRLSPAWIKSQGSEAALEEAARLIRREYYRHSDYERAYGRTSVFRISLIVERQEDAKAPVKPEPPTGTIRLESERPQNPPRPDKRRDYA